MPSLREYRASHPGSIQGLIDLAEFGAQHGDAAAAEKARRLRAILDSVREGRRAREAMRARKSDAALAAMRESTAAALSTLPPSPAVIGALRAYQPVEPPPELQQQLPLRPGDKAEARTLPLRPGDQTEVQLLGEIRQTELPPPSLETTPEWERRAEAQPVSTFPASNEVEKRDTLPERLDSIDTLGPQSFGHATAGFASDDGGQFFGVHTEGFGVPHSASELARAAVARLGDPDAWRGAEGPQRLFPEGVV